MESPLPRNRLNWFGPCYVRASPRFPSHIIILVFLAKKNKTKNFYDSNWKYAIIIFKDWRSAIKNHLIGNLSLQFNHTPKLIVAIQSDMETYHCNSEPYWEFVIQFWRPVELQRHISNFTNCNGITQNHKSCNGIFSINPITVILSSEKRVSLLVCIRRNGRT
jgi:hypothetical protein